MYDLIDYTRLCSICKIMADNVGGLEWVHVKRLNSLRVLDLLAPMVQGKEGGGRSLRQHVSEYRTMSGWSNVTLWWGVDGKKLPYEPPPETGDLKQRQHLFSYTISGTTHRAIGYSQL